MARARSLTRYLLIERLRCRLSTHGFPRAQMLFIIIVSGAAAFLGSMAALKAGLEHMGARYGLAALLGYVGFVGMIRLWIAWQRGRLADLDPDLDPVDVLDGWSSSGTGPGGRVEPLSAFRGGHSGGGGASSSWNVPSAAADRPATSGSGSGSAGFDLDFDDWWPVVVAAICASLVLAALIYTVWIAPALLAEVALDAAVVMPFYNKLRREDVGTWFGSTVRKTWLAAASVVLLMALAGSVLQHAAPEAKSIGGVVEALRTR
jgi:hypothetical protein